MTAFIRYQFLSYIRSLKIIPPVTVYGAWIFILYAYKYVPILSSYAVSSVAVYLIMTWVAMGVFSLEEESEKHILFAHLAEKKRFLWGKWAICVIVASFLILFAIVYPILMNSFIGNVKPIHLGLAIYSHLVLAVLGLLVGTFFSITSFASRKYAWLSAVLVLVVSLSYEGLVEKIPLLVLVLNFFPPVVKVIKYLSGEDSVVLGTKFWIHAAFIAFYIMIAVAVVIMLYLKKER